MNEIELLADEIGTDNDVASGRCCSDCRHILSKFNGPHEETKCYAMDRKGNILSACNCKQIKTAFTIIAKVEINDKVRNEINKPIKPNFTSLADLFKK